MSHIPDPGQAFAIAGHQPARSLGTQTVLTRFIQQAIETDFEIGNSVVNLEAQEETGTQTLSIRMTEEAGNFDRSNMIDLAHNLMTILTELAGAAAEEEEPFPYEVPLSNEKGFVLENASPAFIYELLSCLSDCCALDWRDAKACLKRGYDYSLQDIQQILEMNQVEDETLDLMAPVDMGRPKMYLQ